MHRHHTLHFVNFSDLACTDCKKVVGQEELKEQILQQIAEIDLDTRKLAHILDIIEPQTSK